VGAWSHAHPSSLLVSPALSRTAAQNEELISARGLRYYASMIVAAHLTRALFVIKAVAPRGNSQMPKYSKSQADSSSKLTNNISYQTLPSSPNHSEICHQVTCEDLSDVASSALLTPSSVVQNVPCRQSAVSKKTVTETPVSLISNYPEADEPEISQRDFTVYRLRRQVASLRADVKNKNDKLTKCLLQLVDEQRMYKLGLQEGQWETYSEIQRRLHRIEGLIALIQDPIAGQHTELEELQKMLKKVKAQV
jgi:hypothetical protein